MLFVVVVAGSLTFTGVSYRRALYHQLLALLAEIRLSFQRTRVTVDSLGAISVRQAALEISVVAIIALASTSAFLDPDPHLRLPGGEAEWLTSSAYFAANSLREYGYIPLWQPYLENGEPLIDNPLGQVCSLAVTSVSGSALSPMRCWPELAAGFWVARLASRRWVACCLLCYCSAKATCWR
jgi:hypothetical protein